MNAIIFVDRNVQDLINTLNLNTVTVQKNDISFFWVSADSYWDNVGSGKRRFHWD